MVSLGDDEDDRDLAGSQDGSSDNEIDDTLRDVEDDGDGENDGDVDGDMDGDDDNEPDADVDVEADAESPSSLSQMSETAGAASQVKPDVMMADSGGSNSASDLDSVFHPAVRPECLNASSYDIVPTTAAPHSTSINAITATADMRWVFSGGSDGYIRKFNWVDSINSKLMLTVAQRHPFVDSVVKAGVLMTYWENKDDVNNLSPVYSLASQSEGLWLLSGLETGGIRLQTIRHDEGKCITVLQQHRSAVSVLALTSDEKSLLSGSWDKTIYDWDLNTGQTRRGFGASAGQISAIEIRPESSVPVPQDTVESLQPNGTFSSNTQLRISGGLDLNSDAYETGEGGDSTAVPGAQPPSPADSLFGGADSLFGDVDGGAADGGEPAGDTFALNEDDEFGTALANGVLTGTEVAAMTAEQDMASENRDLTDQSAPSQVAPSNINESKTAASQEAPLPNGLPHAEVTESPFYVQDKILPSRAEPDIVSDTTFLAASIDGTIRIWDRRQPNPVARISPRNVPPWCMSACWSPDGNYIYAGRRNGAVEEFSLHKGLRSSERLFRFPNGSGPVTALKAMPNGRHIVCASHDNLRLYDLQHQQTSRHSTVPFLIIPGHRTGTISQLFVDQACRYMISTSGNRGWEGNTTEVLLGYEIGAIR